MGNKWAKVLTLLKWEFNTHFITVHIFVVHDAQKCYKVNMCLKACSIPKEGVKILAVMLSSAPINTEQPVCVKTPCNIYTGIYLFKVKLINHVNQSISMQVDQGSYLWKGNSFILEIPLLSEYQNLVIYIIIKYINT